MPNYDPIYGKVYKNPRVTLASGSATYDGSAATLLFTADATSGSKVVRMFAQPRGAINTPCVLRVYKASGGANFALIREWPLAAVTASQSIASNPIELQFNLGLEASGQIYVQLSAYGTGSGWDIMLEAMDY